MNMRGRIYHICEDEKFINSAIYQFEAVIPNNNTFYIFMNDEIKEIVHVKMQSFTYRVNADSLLEVLNVIKDNDIVVFHSLSPHFYNFLLALPKKIKTVWLCFGFEVYNNQDFFNEDKLLDPITLARYSEPKPKKKFKKRVKDFTRPFFRFFNPKIPYTKEEKIKKSFNRIDYLGSSFKEEFANITSLIKMKKRFFSFWYYPIEQIVNVKEEIHLDKKNILIGNSGFKTGNHLDVLDEIKKFKLGDSKVLMPLSYGNQEYIEDIIEKGKELLGKNFEPITEFKPINQYNLDLQTVGTAIFYNKRQQALGNTIALLWFGAKVFLSNKNHFYNFLKRNNILVYSVEEDLNEKSCQEFLNLEQIEYNRKIIFALLNAQQLIHDLKQQLKIINE